MEDLRHDLPRAYDLAAASRQGDGHLAPPRLAGKLVYHQLCLLIEGEGLQGEHLPALFQPGEAENVAHQIHQALALVADLAGEASHILRPCQAVADELGEADDGGEGRLELVAHVGRELPPQAILPVVLGVEILHLPPDLPVLLRQAPHHGLELVLHVPLVGAGEVDSV